MSIVKHKDKRTGITYVYESESYWDKEKQQPRSKRKLIGRLDETTGEIVPTDGRGRKRKDKNNPPSENTVLCDSLRAKVKERDLTISELTAENKALKKKLSMILKEINVIISKHEIDV